ncbi:MAG: hypothetical protein ABIP94_12620 [Planctomycetota bacterium]
MTERMRWWVIPGAMIVLLRVVTLGGVSEPVEEQSPPVEAVPEVGLAVVRDATSQRRGPRPMINGELILVVEVPEQQRGQRGVMTIWRRTNGQREAESWVVLRLRVRNDATLPIACLAAGRYDIEFEFGEGQDTQRLFASAAVVPGTVLLQPLPR